MTSYQAMSEQLLRPEDNLPQSPSPIGRRLGRTLLALVAAVALGFMAFIGATLFGMWWSDHHLAPVQLGMSPSEVRALAGEPLRTVKVPSGTCWVYTRWWSADAEVFFDATDRVRADVTD